VAEKKDSSLKNILITCEDVKGLRDLFDEKTRELNKLAIGSDGSINKTYIEQTKGDLTKKHYDTTGYRYQRLVNILNEVVGSCHWRGLYKLVDRIDGEAKSGQKKYSICLEVKVQIGNPMPDGTFDVLDEKVCFGGSSSADIDNAYKGAYTNGLKKTLALMGLGSCAYTGELHQLLHVEIPEGDDDNDYEEDAISHKSTSSTSTNDNSEKIKCVVTGEVISQKQAQYCEEHGLKPAKFDIIKQYRSDGKLDELKV
jgi:hypothetical protein